MVINVAGVTLNSILRRVQLERTTVAFAVPNELELKLIKHRVGLSNKNVVCTVYDHIQEIKADYVVVLFAEQFVGICLAPNVIFIYGELQ